MCECVCVCTSMHTPHWLIQSNQIIINAAQHKGNLNCSISPPAFRAHASHTHTCPAHTSLSQGVCDDVCERAQANVRCAGWCRGASRNRVEVLRCLRDLQGTISHYIYAHAHAILYYIYCTTCDKDMSVCVCVFEFVYSTTIYMMVVLSVCVCVYVSSSVSKVLIFSYGSREWYGLCSSLCLWCFASGKANSSPGYMALIARGNSSSVLAANHNIHFEGKQSPIYIYISFGIYIYIEAQLLR